MERERFDVVVFSAGLGVLSAELVLGDPVDFSANEDPTDPVRLSFAFFTTTLRTTVRLLPAKARCIWSGGPKSNQS